MIDAYLQNLLRSLCGAKAKIEAQTKLYGDLRLSGDDAVELLEGIRNGRGIDFTTFEFSRLFPDETNSLTHYWGLRLGLWRNRFEPLTVGHLDAVIRRGQWFDPLPP